MISTKGRYALRTLIDLAQRDGAQYTPLKEIAERQEISLKYMERIIPSLTCAKLVVGVHGKGGGYKLTKAPEDYNAWEILVAVEPNLSPVACLKPDAEPCDRAATCETLPLWKEFNETVKNFFESKSLAALAGIESPDNYVI